jgi:hypothetical protein
MAPDPWAFGWTQALTITGFVITILIALGGFRSFGRWRREQLEGKRIEIAIEALTIAYKTKFVFGHIRSVMASGGEWADMPMAPDDNDDKRSRRGSFYAVFKRIELNKDYFDGVWALQPKFMAVFGPETENIFSKVHEARRNIEVAAQMLYQQAVEPYRHEERDESTRKLYNELRGHIWEGMGRLSEKGDEVGVAIEAFKVEIEKVCLPLLAEFRRSAPA